MLQPALDCVLSPELGCFFESEPIACEEPVEAFDSLFDSPDFSNFLALLDTSMGDAVPDAGPIKQEPSEGEVPAPAGQQQQATSSAGSPDSADDSQRSFGSAGSAAHHSQTSTPTSSAAEPVSNPRDSHTATSTIKVEQLPFINTRAAKDQQHHHTRHRAASAEQATSGKSCLPEDSSQCAPSSPDSSKSNKRKLPEIDWRSIDDPEERRRQRRLAKNRVTAARSRERKKLQWNEMQQKMDDVEDENMRLKDMLDKYLEENSVLKDQLASLTRGASTAVCGGGEEPAALLHIAKSLLFRLPLLAAETVWKHSFFSRVFLASIFSASMILSRSAVVHLMLMPMQKKRTVPFRGLQTNVVNWMLHATDEMCGPAGLWVQGSCQCHASWHILRCRSLQGDCRSKYRVACLSVPCDPGDVAAWLVMARATASVVQWYITSSSGPYVFTWNSVRDALNRVEQLHLHEIVQYQFMPSTL